MRAERGVAGAAGWVTGHARRLDIARGETRDTAITALVAAAWDDLPTDQRAKVDASLVLKLVALFGVRGRPLYRAITAIARQFGVLGKPEEMHLETHALRPVLESSKLPRWIVPAPPDAIVALAMKAASRTQPVVRRDTIRHVMAEPIDVWYETIRQLSWACAHLYQLGKIEPDVRSGSTTDLLHGLVLHVSQKDGSTPAETWAALWTQLRETVSGRLASGEYRPVLAGDSTALAIEWQPTTLRAALWLEVARLMEGSQTDAIRFVPCALRCGELMVFTGDRKTGTRDGSKYCSAACTQRAYRRRQSRARTLHRRGWSIEAIAIELNVSPKQGRTPHEIVTGWLGPRKRR